MCYFKIKKEIYMFRSIRNFYCNNVLWIHPIIVAIVFALFYFGIYEFIEVHKDSAKSNYEEGYLDACKDFYKGELKYVLVENPDGTKEWKRLK
jgi:hypothetical protein